MKRIYLFMTVVLCYMAATAQEFSLSVGDAEAFLTEDMNLEVSLDNSSEISSLQCDVILPDGFTINGSPALSNRAKSSHSIRHNVNRDGVLRVVIHSSKSENVDGNSGILFTLPLTTTKECPTGENSVVFDNVIMSSADGKEFKAQQVANRVMIKELPIHFEQDLTLPLGSSETLQLTFLPEYTYEKKIAWTSSNERTVRVSENGVVSAVGLGTATITACVANGIHTECKVTVVEVKAERIELNKTVLQLIPGKNETLIATVYPENTTNKTVTWSSSDESVAKVSTKGYVQAIALGNATITATCGDVSEKCELSVQEIVISATEFDIPIGRTAQIRITMWPKNFGNCTWTSSDENIVKVSGNGTIVCDITGVNYGIAMITGTDGKYTVTCKVNVTPVYAQYISTSNLPTYMNAGQSSSYYVTISPGDVTDKTLTWTTSDPSVVNFNGEESCTNDLCTITITAGIPGTATICATAVGGTKLEKTITVKEVKPVSISLDKYSLWLNVGETYQLHATINPTNTTYKTIVWSTSDETVATISDDGLLTAVRAGTVNVTAQCGSVVSGKCQITIREVQAQSVSVEYDNTMLVGATSLFTATVSPKNTTNKTVTWKTSNEGILKIDDIVVSVDGKSIAKVRAVAIGSAVITATTVGGKTFSCNVTVNPIPSEAIILNKETISLLVGSEETLSATVLPENTTDKTVTWSSSDEKVAKVSPDGVVKAIGVGTAVVTAKNGSSVASCTVTVNPILAETLTLNTSEISLMVAQTSSLIATIAPENTTDKTIKWTSSDENVAKVGAEGLITAFGVGDAIITANCGTASAICTVHVSTNLFTVTYMVDGEIYKTESVAYGTAINAIAEPTKEGYTFSGWSEISETMPANNVTVIGTFTVNTYTITYIVDGEEYKTETYQFGAKVTPLAEPTKEGFTFSGWSTIPETMPANNVTVTGSFSVNTYTITYIIDSEVYKSELYEYGTAVTPLDEPTKEGHTFSGWSEIPGTMPANDVTITGSFSVNTYSIIYIVDGEEYKTETYEFGTAIAATDEPTKEGHTFSGWSEIPASMPAKDVIVTGTFSINSYTMTYVVDGEVYKAELYEFGATVTPLSEPTKEGYTFSGWSEIPGTMPAHDVTVTGTFTVNTYTITYLVDGEVYKTEQYDFGATIIPADEPTKEGETFSGWSTIPETMPANNVTVTGSFTVNTYTITYIVDSEVYKTEQYEFGAEITPADEPTKEGETFSGWSDIPETMPAHDVTVTGIFTINKYMVRYYDGESLLAEFEVEFGAEIPLYEYNNEEYIFERWEGETYEVMPAHDIEYYAVTTPNGIAETQIDDNEEIVVYNLTGLIAYKGKKAEMPKHLKGLYVIKCGDKTIKCQL